MRVPARFDVSALLLWVLAALGATGLALCDAADAPSTPPRVDAGPHFYDVAEIEQIYGLPPLEGALDAGTLDAGVTSP